MGFDNVNVNVCGGQSIIKALQNYNTVILKPNIVDNRNVLTQEMMSERHTKYVIRWNYSLEGATINVPEDCIIEFAGGTIDHGTIVGNNTILIYSKPIDEVCLAEKQGTFIYNTTVADEEDITSASGQLKFKDRPNTDGMGRKILRKNIVNGVNTLTQSMMTQTNTIYVIQYDFTLGEDITVPANCVLEFDGGSISGEHTITFTDTKIVANKEVFDISAVAGTIANKEVYLSWWKLAYNNNTNDAILINQIIAAIDNCVFYYDIQDNIYVGGACEVAPNPSIVNHDYSIQVIGKNHIEIIQTTPYFTILKGTSMGGETFRIAQNDYVRVVGVNLDANNIHCGITGENGFGIVGKTDGSESFVDVCDCVVKNCQKGFDAEAVYGDIYVNGYPEYGSGGKGFQVEGGANKCYVHNCIVYNSYIGLSHVMHITNNNITSYDHITVQGCEIAIVCLSLGRYDTVSYTNINILDCTGENGLICMGQAFNVIMSGITVKGSATAGSLLRGSYNTCMIDIVCEQKCTRLIDLALFRDNPEGEAKAFSIVKIVTTGGCDYVIGDSILQYPKTTTNETKGKFQGGQYYIETLNGTLVEGSTLSDMQWNTPLFKITLGALNKYYEGSLASLLSTHNAIPMDITKIGSTRPTNPPLGFMFLETTGSGSKPIWWDGSYWVDATGTSV